MFNFSVGTLRAVKCYFITSLFKILIHPRLTPRNISDLLVSGVSVTTGSGRLPLLFLR